MARPSVLTTAADLVTAAAVVASAAIFAAFGLAACVLALPFLLVAAATSSGLRRPEGGSVRLFDPDRPR